MNQFFHIIDLNKFFNTIIRFSDFFIRSHRMPMATSKRHKMPTKAAMAILSSSDLSSGEKSDVEAAGRSTLI
jgi:hypothetical protein